MSKDLKNTVWITFLFFANLMFIQAQEKDKKIINDFTSLVNESSSFKNYKVIEKTTIDNFQAKLIYYVQNEQKVQSLLWEEINSDENKISNLQKQLDVFRASNNSLLNEKSTIRFFGFSIDKSNYSIAMWVLFFGTFFGALFLFFKFKEANKIAKYSKSVLKDLENEYESYRRACIEREQNLGRQLFTEIKKNKELIKAS